MSSLSLPDPTPAVLPHSLDPLTVASCPPSPTTTRRAPLLPLPLPQLRTLVNKFKSKAKPKARSQRLPFPAHTSPPRTRSRRAIISNVTRHARLTICDAAFFLPGLEVENGYADAEYAYIDAENAVDDEEEDTENDAGFRAPPPTPLDPFHTPTARDPFRTPTPPHTPVFSSTENTAARRAAQERKIVQMFGPEAGEAARTHVAQSVGGRSDERTSVKAVEGGSIYVAARISVPEFTASAGLCDFYLASEIPEADGGV
ncbi:hypothetical protein FB451DRAFT_1360198 [Mycena latifolia]|nr:hypothetical protein FB451DRAFT_1360198 [Mycena latifolia]